MIIVYFVLNELLTFKTQPSSFIIFNLQIQDSIEDDQVLQKFVIE